MSVANAVGFASVSESQGFAFAVASETSLDAKRSVASKFFDWGCDAVQQARECPEAVRLSGHWWVLLVQGLAGAASSLRMVRRGKYGHSELKSIADVAEICGGCASSKAGGNLERTSPVILAGLPVRGDDSF